METIKIGTQILWDESSHCIGNGEVVRMTEKAVLIHFEIAPCTAGNMVTYNQGAWVPKSQIKVNNHSDGYELKPWIIHNMKRFFIKYYSPDWAKKTTTKTPTHKDLQGWDGHSRKGQAIYDQLFEREKEEGEKHDPSDRYGFYND